MYEWWSSVRFEGHLSGKVYYVKGEEEARNFTYYYYNGTHMSPHCSEKYRRRLDLSQLYLAGETSILILDEEFDKFPDSVSIFEKIKKGKVGASKLLTRQTLEKVDHASLLSQLDYKNMRRALSRDGGANSVTPRATHSNSMFMSMCLGQKRKKNFRSTI